MNNMLLRICIWIACICLLCAAVRAQMISPMDDREAARFTAVTRAVEKAGYLNAIVVGHGTGKTDAFSRSSSPMAAIALFPSTRFAAQQAEPIRVADSVQEKKLIKRVEPVYSESARQVPVRGPVVLDVIANEKGEVVDVKIVRGGNPVVQTPVYEAVKQWRYSPTYVDGKAVSVKFRVTVPVVVKK